MVLRIKSSRQAITGKTKHTYYKEQILCKLLNICLGYLLLLGGIFDMEKPAYIYACEQDECRTYFGVSYNGLPPQTTTEHTNIDDFCRFLEEVLLKQVAGRTGDTITTLVNGLNREYVLHKDPLCLDSYRPLTPEELTRLSPRVQMAVLISIPHYE